MKKVTIIIASIFCISLASQAQVQFGLTGGANFSTITGDNAGIKSFAINGYVGALAHIPLSTQFAVEPQLVYSMEGCKFTTTNINGTFSGSLNATFINLPVLAHFNAGGGVIIQSGPQIGLLLSASQNVDKQGSSSIKDQLKSTNLSWVFGAGYQLPGSNVGFTVHYNMGLSNINKDNSSVSHTSVLQAGLFFMLGGK